MNIQYQILLYMVCLNLASTMVMALSLPGTTFFSPIAPSNSSKYEEKFNATQMLNTWNPFTGVPFLGDVFSMVSMTYNAFRFLLAGFPTMLQWIGDSYITDPAARTAFDFITIALTALFAISMFVLFLELISGRNISD